VGDRFYATVRTLSLPVIKAWLRLRVEGIERVPATGPVILLANHASYLDPAVLGRACPRKVHFLIKRKIYETPGLQWFFRGMDAIPVVADPTDTSALRRALRLLAAGEVLGVFPEGGRSRDGSLAEGKTGAALLASRSMAPLLPVGIRGAHEAMPMGAAWPRPRRVEVVFGHPFQPPAARGVEGRRVLEGVADRYMEEIAALVAGEPSPFSRTVSA
jgi:1-acyl-sn-glycerol-3-phosphate acyltransferase